jgi:hypothetical protein
LTLLLLINSLLLFLFVEIDSLSLVNDSLSFKYILSINFTKLISPFKIVEEVSEIIEFITEEENIIFLFVKVLLFFLFYFSSFSFILSNIFSFFFIFLKIYFASGKGT